MIPTTTLMLLSLSGMALLLSIFALSVALRSSARLQSKQLSAHSTRLQELELEIDELRQEVQVQMKRERMRANMAATRARRKATESDEPEGSSNGIDSEEAKDRWTRETNLKIARGDIRPLGRR